LYRHVTGFVGIPELELNHVFFPLGEEGLMQVFGRRRNLFTRRGEGMPYPVALVRRILGIAGNVDQLAPSSCRPTRKVSTVTCPVGLPL
jgi:hypothetical protein